MTRKNTALALRALALASLAVAARPAGAALCTVTQKDLDGNGSLDLRIVASTHPQKVIIDAYQDQTVVSLDCNGGGFGGPPASGDLFQKVLPAFGRYELRLKGKDDVTFNVVGDWSGQSRSLEVVYGGGLNRLNLGGTGALRDGTRLTVDVLGVLGSDRLSINVPAMDASSLLVRGDLNMGNNGANVVAARPITNGSVASLSFDLAGVVNDFAFSHTGLLDATLDVSFDGSNGTDTGTAAFAGDVGPAGRLHLRSSLWQGNDRFVGAVDLGALSIAAGGEVHVEVAAGPGNDVLNLGPAGTTGSPLLGGLLDVAFKGGEGNDTIALNLGAGGFTMDGTLRLRADGESGADTLNGTVEVALGSQTPRLDASFHGGHGADTVNLTINDNGPGGAASYGPAGTAFVDGGTASDTCNVAGSGLIHERNCEH
jgi:hypothetical protein